MARRRSRSLGNVSDLECTTEKVYLNKVALDRGGYSQGRYFGQGEPLYYFDNRDSWGYFRARDRKDAKAKLRARCPRIKFAG